MGFFGDQEYHTFVRFRAACEMIENAANYDSNSPEFVLKDDRIQTSSIQDLIEDITTDGAYAELMHIYAISAAFNVCLESYSPPTAAIGIGASPCRAQIVGRGVRPTSAPAFVLMWSTTRMPGPREPFIPNHIVLLVDRTSSNNNHVILVDSDDTDDYDADEDQSFVTNQADDAENSHDAGRRSDCSTTESTATDDTVAQDASDASFAQQSEISKNEQTVVKFWNLSGEDFLDRRQHSPSSAACSRLDITSI